MSVLLKANASTGQLHDFFAYDDSEQVWDGAAFVPWVDGSFASYRIPAVESGTSGRYSASGPDGTVAYELRFRGATLALSDVVWTDVVAASGSLTEAERTAVAVRCKTIGMAEVKAAVTPDDYSEYTEIMMHLSSGPIAAGLLPIRNPDGTAWQDITITVAADSDPITATQGI